MCTMRHEISVLLYVPYVLFLVLPDDSSKNFGRTTVANIAAQ